MKRRPFLTPIWLSALMALLIVGVLALQVWMWLGADSATIILVRSAQTAPANGEDRPLAAGDARAARLAKLFEHTGGSSQLDAIYVTPTLRSRMIAAPLAAKLGLTPIDAAAGNPQTLIGRILRDHSGRNVLVVVDGDGEAALTDALSGGKDRPPIRADDYGSMTVITVPRFGRATFLRLNY